jgi:hypothetical protein
VKNLKVKVYYPQLLIADTVGYTMKHKIPTTYTFPANGKWHTILTSPNGLSAFEIIGYAQGISGHGRYW